MGVELLRFDTSVVLMSIPSKGFTKLVKALHKCKSAKIRTISHYVFHYGLFGGVPPPETAIEMFLEPEGWCIVESKPFVETIMTKEQIENCRISRSLYSANKGISYNK